MNEKKLPKINMTLKLGEQVIDKVSSVKCNYTNGKDPKVEEKTVSSMAKVREEI